MLEKSAGLSEMENPEKFSGHRLLFRDAFSLPLRRLVCRYGSNLSWCKKMEARVIYGVACAGIFAGILGLTIPSHVRDAKSGRPEISASQPSQGPSQIGLASFYDTPQKTASGEQFNPADLTAAHNTLRFGSRARVTNLKSGKFVSVRINDRGPYAGGRIIDLSKKAAQTIGIGEKGFARVEVTPEAR